MRTFVVALALGGLSVGSAADCSNGVAGAVLVDYAAFTGIVLEGTRGAVGAAGTVGTSLAANAVTTYKLDVGYTGTVTTATQTCHASDGTVIVPDIVVSGCAAGYTQSTYGAAVASGASTGAYVCTACTGIQTAAAKVFQASSGAEVCVDVAACTLPAATLMTNGMVSDATVGANGCPAAAGTLAAGTKCTYTLDPAYKNAAAGTPAKLVMSCPITPGTTTAPTIKTGDDALLATGAWMKSKNEGCAVGYYQSLDGVNSATPQPTCAKCDAGKTSSGVGTFLATAIVKDVTCKYCAADFYQTAGTDATGAGLVCTACAKGYTKVSGAPNNPKATAALVAGDKCDVCASGYRQDVAGTVGTGTCAACPDNQYITPATLGSSVTFCTGCKKNNYQNTATLAVASATSTCADCNGGVSTAAAFAASGASTMCSGCPLDTYQSAGSSATWSNKHTCTACGAGFKTLAAQSGWVATDLTATSCVACIIGTAGSCATGCPADHYQSAGHVGSCTEKGAAASPATTVAGDKTNCGAATTTALCGAIVTSSATDAVTTKACDWADAAAGLALVKCVKCATGKTLTNTAVTGLQTAAACTTPKAAAVSSGVVAKASVATAVAAALAAASVLV